MAKRLALKTLLALAAVLALATPALAGGAAVIVLDETPTDVRAGDTLHLGFTVLQHGVRPVHYWEGMGPVTPRLVATHRETGEALRADAVADGAVEGHFTVDVTFPGEGTWEWAILPEPFALLNTFEPLTVLPGGAPRAAAAPASAPGTAQLPSSARIGLQAAGALLLLASAAVALASRRSRPAAVPSGD